MKTLKRAFLAAALFAALLMFQSSVSAEIFQGHVYSVDPAAGYLSMLYQDPETGRKENVKILVPAGTSISGTRDLSNLQAADEITVGARKAYFFFGPWKADYLEANMNAGKSAEL